MKTTNVFPQFLVASAVLFGTISCSTSNTGTGSGTTSGSSASSGMSTDATSGSSSVGGAGTEAAARGTSAGTISDTGTAGTSVAGASGAAAATDMTAFMGTFATMQDPVFLMTAASSNLLELQLGQAAAQRASNADVKRFAQMMVDHHTKATQQLKSVATPLGVTMPQTMMPIHQAMADKVLAKSGKEFDEAYMDAMETAHRMDVAMFEVKDKAADTPTVKSFATQTLPMLRSHEKMADELEKKVD
jgi:putative membrane protein